MYGSLLFCTCYPALDLTRYVALQLKVNAACEELVKDVVLDHAYWKAARAWYTNSALEELTNFLTADKRSRRPSFHSRPAVVHLTLGVRSNNGPHSSTIGQSRPVVNPTSLPAKNVPSA